VRQERYLRKSIRLPGYDYSTPAWYFVTICIKSRLPLLGVVRDGEMRPNAAGEMVRLWWEKLPTKFQHTDLDMFVIMPNHVHGIVIINDPLLIDPHSESTVVSSSLSTMMQWFKTMTTNAYIDGVRASAWPRFDGQLWQRTFYDHIIRGDNDFDLDRVRTYIEANPARWEEDQEHIA